MHRRFGSLSALLLAALTLVLVLGGLPASAAGTAQGSIVNLLPDGNTPNIADGTDVNGDSYRVFDMAQVGSWIVVAGVFTSVSNVAPNGTASFSRRDIFAFNKATGAV